MLDDWFRRTTWTEDDQNDFLARLNRSRRISRSQYLRIQALHLAETNNLDKVVAALDLLDVLFDQYADPTELAAAFLQKAQCLRQLGRTSEAIEYFKKSIDFQRAFPNVQTDAPIEFGLLVAQNRLVAEYTSVFEVLDEFESNPLLPIGRFNVAAIKAIIWADSDKFKLAKKAAEQALAEAGRNNSGLRNHPDVGLIGKSEAGLILRMKEIVTGT